MPPLASAIHQTYSAIAKPQATGIFDAPDADAVDEQPRHRDDEQQKQRERDAKADPPPARRSRSPARDR